MSAYVDGASRDGWCCATNACHRTFPHQGSPCRAFARFLLHRAARHGKLQLPKTIGSVDVSIRLSP